MIVLGGNGLIGRAVVAAVAAAGGIAVAASRKKPAGTAEWVRADVTSARSLDKAFADVQRRHGPVTGVVNCTLPKGKGYGRTFEDVRFADFGATVGAHLGGAFLACQRAIRYFRRRDEGAIVNVASVYGFMAPRFEIYAGTAMTKEIEYAVSKAGIIQMTAYLASYLKGTKIRVNCVSPGGVRDGQDARFLRRYDKMCATKGMLDPADVAGAVLFLLSDESRHVVGQNIVVDDGFSL